MQPDVVAALATAGRVWLARGTDWQLNPISLGRPRTGGMLGPARHWTAATAYVTPLHRTDVTGAKRPDLTPDAQLLDELASRGLPAPCTLTWSDIIPLYQGNIEAMRFVRTGRAHRAPRGAWLGAPTMAFEKPVSGPLAFGFGAHFGLGLMTPLPSIEEVRGTTRHPAVLRRRGFEGPAGG